MNSQLLLLSQVRTRLYRLEVSYVHNVIDAKAFNLNQ